MTNTAIRRDKSAISDSLLTKIIAQHGLWKYRLVRAIETRTSSFTPEVVAHDDRCPLGKWIYGEGAHLIDAGTYAYIRRQHAQFHNLASTLLSHALGRRGEQARAGIAPRSEFSRVSADLVLRLEQLRDSRSIRDIGAGQVEDMFEEIAGAVVQVAAQSSEAATATTEANAHLNSLAAAVEEMSTSVGSIAESAVDSAQVASDALERSSGTNQRMIRLQESVASIGGVLGVIEQIATQTRLLALNATIEAARAGEAGKGFSVVANEVKQLAGNVGAATKQVSDIVDAVQNEAAGAIGDIHNLLKVIDRINEGQTTIAGSVEEQSSVTQEISGQINEVARMMADIDENTSSAAMASNIALDTVLT